MPQESVWEEWLRDEEAKSNHLRAEIALLRAVAGTFLDEQTEANAEALRRILTEQLRDDKSPC